MNESRSRHRSKRARDSRLDSTVHGRKVLVLVTDGYGDRGGIAKFNRDLLDAIAGDPAIARVIAIPRLMTGSAGLLPEKLEYLTRGLGGKARYAFSVLATLWKIRDFNVVICGHINLLPVALVAKVITRSPLILILHGIEAWKPTPSRLVNFLVRYVDGYVTVSNYTRDRFNSWAHLEDTRTWVLPNCIDSTVIQSRPKNSTLLKRYGLEKKKIIVTCGRLVSRERYKGFDEVIELLPELAQEIPEIAYLIMGQGDDMERLKAKALRLGVGDKVIFTGYVPESEKNDHYCLGDAYVMPSRGEGFGIVYLEAMACGLPVVGSKLDGSQDALRDGQLGILVDPGDPEDIKRGIRAALERGRNVPEGLEYFSSDNFKRRVRSIVEAFQ